MAADVKTGQPLAEPLSGSGLFPPLLVQIVSVGEQAGQLDELLLNAADTFDGQADAAIYAMNNAFGAVSRAPGMGKIVIPQPEAKVQSWSTMRYDDDRRFRNFVHQWAAYVLNNGTVKRWIIETFATVGVSLDDKRYVMPAGINRVADELDRRGIEPIQITYDQVSFWGGSVSCSTQALSRTP